MTIIRIENAVLSGAGPGFRAPVNLTVEKGEHLAITGPNASGKTLLTELITGRRPVSGGRVSVSGSVRSISFTDSYGSADASYYHQQRWNHGDMDEETPTVGSALSRIAGDGHPAPGQDDGGNDRVRGLLSEFGLADCMEEPVICLSSGELRKFQLIKLLLSSPDILIVDNPFIGLDASARGIFSSMLERLSKDRTVILVLPREEEIPQFVTHTVRMDDLSAGAKTPWMQDTPEVLRFRDVTVRYGGRTILNRLNWCVRKGEHWALTGENGSGKSLLLSLVCADNPMAYACDISLFGRRRGSGESIWEIKRRIGYVSPELHRSFKLASTGMEVVCSGFHDTPGIARAVSAEQEETASRWMDTFGITRLKDRSFSRMSSGEQRMCLLARAFVKDPELLVLDEPMHGLDEGTRMKVRDILNRWASAPDRTLIMVTHYMEELPSCIDRRMVLVKSS